MKSPALLDLKRDCTCTVFEETQRKTSEQLSKNEEQWRCKGTGKMSKKR